MHSSPNLFIFLNVTSSGRTIPTIPAALHATTSDISKAEVRYLTLTEKFLNFLREMCSIHPRVANTIHIGVENAYAMIRTHLPFFRQEQEEISERKSLQ